MGYYKKYFLLSLFWVWGAAMFAQNPNWTAPNSTEFSNTATVISNLFLDNIPSNNVEDKIAFFVGDEIRGLSSVIPIGNSNYLHFITLYSNESIEEMDIKMYHKETDKVYGIAVDFTFETGGVYGAVDLPFSINAYVDGNPPLYFQDIPDQQTLQSIPFAQIDLTEYFVQEGNNDIVWSFTPNSDLDVNLMGSLLQVSGAEGFLGSTSLTVRATQIVAPSEITNPQFGIPQVDNSYVETTINYIVLPIYNAPAWNHIPPQSIVKGDEFDPLNLHDYEYQYDGPAIQYDYLPILLPLKDPEPAPDWEFSDFLEVNMSMYIQMNYTPKYQFHHENDRIAAFVGGEIRGVCRIDSLSGLFFLTIGGDVIENSIVDLKFYSGLKGKTYDIDSVFNFEPYHIQGSIEEPVIFDLSPLLPIVPNIPIPGGVATVPIEIVDTSFVGIEHFKFIAFDPLYPDLLYADTSTSFCIAESVLDFNTLYADYDGDGLGNPDITVQSCEGVINYVFNSDDCDDTNTIFCSEPIEVGTDSIACEATGVILIEPTFIDCHVTSIINDAPPAFPKGQTVVTWTLEFNETVTKSCNQIVTVVDDDAPIPENGGDSLIWNEITSLMASDGHLDQQFGYSVDISKDWAVVGARKDNELGPSAGAAYILKNEEGIWVEYSKILASNGLKQDEFGYSVSISGNRVLVGAIGVDENGIDKGAAYVFTYDGINWVESAILLASNGSDGDLFGTSVSISNEILIVGASGEDTNGVNSGAAYVFELKSGWTEVAILKANDAEDNDEFGCSVSLSGFNAIVGARYEDSDGINAGAAYIYERDENIGTWPQVQKLIASNTGTDFEFGASVDISGDHAIVGSPRNTIDGLNSGAAYVFSKFGIDWVQEQFLIPENGLPNYEFGKSVSISANYAAVGSPMKIVNGVEGGATFVFRNDGNVWAIQDTVFASDAGEGDLFGSAIAIYGHTVINGAFSNDNPIVDGGRCYVHILDASLDMNDSACPITFDLPIAIDNCDGEVLGVLSSISEYTGLGIYEISWIYTDSSGNSSFQYQFVLIGEDSIPPILNCPQELILELDETGNLVVALDENILLPSDNCGMVSLDYFPDSFNCSNLGMDTLFITASDAMNNITTCEIPVVINEGPKIVKNLNNDGIGSLRYLIEGSCGGDQSIIYFDTLLNGSIQLLPPYILLDRDIEIVGLGKDVIDIDANNTIRIFEVEDSISIILRELQLSNGEELIDGGAILNKGTLKLDNVRFIGNKENNSPKSFTNEGEIYIIGGEVEIKE